jgi:hypothetical protein
MAADPVRIYWPNPFRVVSANLGSRSGARRLVSKPVEAPLNPNIFPSASLTHARSPTIVTRTRQLCALRDITVKKTKELLTPFTQHNASASPLVSEQAS